MTTNHQIIAQAMQRPAWQSPLMPNSDELWVHPQAARLDLPYTNTLLNLRDGGLLTCEGRDALISMDQGRSWDRFPLFASDSIKPAFEYALVRCASGAIVLVYVDTSLRGSWKWNDQTHEANGLPLYGSYCIRSSDEGRSWSAPVKLCEHGGTIIQGIVTRTGRIAIPLQPFLTQPGRWGQMICFSDDEGRTWRTSSILDVGGHGHHDGAMEGCLAELGDGRLWLLMRTNLDYFWQSFSHDGGLTWEAPAPSTIDASSSPGWLSRLSSGRLMLAWNRLYPQGLTAAQQAQWDRAGGDCNSCKPVSSWHRHELAVAFSEDDGLTWSQAVVVLRDKRVAYPTILERRPGTLWITTRFSQRLAIAMEEDALIKLQASSDTGLPSQGASKPQDA